MANIKVYFTRSGKEESHLLTPATIGKYFAKVYDVSHPNASTVPEDYIPIVNPTNIRGVRFPHPNLCPGDFVSVDGAIFLRTKSGLEFQRGVR